MSSPGWETRSYRMNQVPELSYLKFLQLLGIELPPPEPAHQLETAVDREQLIMLFDEVVTGREHTECFL